METAALLAAGATWVVGNAQVSPAANGAPPAYTPLAIDDSRVHCASLPPPTPIYPGHGPGSPQAQQLADHGQVLANARFVNVYVGSWWDTPAGLARRQSLDAFMQSYPTAPINQILAEYGAPQASFGGSVVLDQIAPPMVDNVMTDQIAAQLAAGTAPDQVRPDSGSALKERLTAGGDLLVGLAGDALRSRQGTSTEAVTVYNEIVEPGTVLVSGLGGGTSRDGLGGFHANAVGPNAGAVLYTATVWPSQGNGIDVGDALASEEVELSHEMGEARTNPYPRSGWWSPVPGAPWWSTSVLEAGDAADMNNVWVMCDSNGNAEQPFWSFTDQAYEVRPGG